MNTSCEPIASIVNTARPSESRQFAAWWRASPSLAASTQPAIASAIPTHCTTVGRSPSNTPTTTGTAALVAAIGATTLIAPIASAR